MGEMKKTRSFPTWICEAGMEESISQGVLRQCASGHARWRKSAGPYRVRVATGKRCRARPNGQGRGMSIEANLQISPHSHAKIRHFIVQNPLYRRQRKLLIPCCPAQQCMASKRHLGLGHALMALSSTCSSSSNCSKLGTSTSNIPAACMDS